jgi:DNA-binding XRE family transcriptional regulator
MTFAFAGDGSFRKGNHILRDSLTFGKYVRYYTLTLPRPIVPPKGYPVAPRGLGEHIRKKRMDLGLLQAQVAQRTGVTKSTVYNWEHGRMPATQHQARIIEFLGYQPEL